MVQALRTTRVRGDETRARVLTAAVTLFATYGFEGTTVRAIARECGVTDAALYYHFETKRDILEALWEEHLNVVPPQAPAHGLNRDALKSRLEVGFAFWVENDVLSRVVWRLALENDKAAMAFRERSLQANRDAITPALVALYGEAGRVIAEALIAMLSGVVMDAILQYGADFPAVVRQPAFRRRTSELIDLLLPQCPVTAPDGAA